MTRRVAHDEWIERLSEYLDGELPPAEQQACEAHVRGCDDCGTVLSELRHVVARAERMNTSIEPARDLWPGIARRLTARPGAVAGAWRVPVRMLWLRPRLAFAAVILVSCLAIVAWSIHRQAQSPVRQGAATNVHAPAADDGDRQYESTVAALDRQARARLTLDPHVVQVLDENLATLDAAIATYRDALAVDPGDAQLRKRLDAARQRKLRVLQQAVTLAAEGTE